MTDVELLLGLLMVVALLATLAQRVGVPYPILMVVGGLALALVPNLPDVRLTPDVVLLVFLPPILFGAGFSTSIRDLRANMRAIGQLAVGLVVATMVAVALVARALVPELSWGAALALGAVVSPPDAIAATSVARRLALPQRMVVVLEGEGMINDATALTAYRLAVAAAMGATIGAGGAFVQLIFAVIGGILIGWAVGRATVWVLGHLEQAPVEVTVTLIAPFAAYLPAERLGASGVLAAVVAGLIVGRGAARVLTSESRLLSHGVWEMVLFLVNAFVFVLIGLQLRSVIGAAQRSIGEFLAFGLAITAVVVAVRFAWIFSTARLPWFSAGRRRPGWRSLTVLSWAGMRGSVSLAAALALPVAIPGGPGFPERDLVLVATFVVIVFTLVGQGLTLPPLIRWLGVTGAEEWERREEDHARQVATHAALDRLEGLAQKWPGHRPLIDQLRQRYEHRSEHAAEAGDPAADQELLEHREIRREVIDSERLAVIGLRDNGEINDEVLRQIERELDLEELRMEA